MGKRYTSILETIGHTPLIELQRLSKGLKAKVSVKVEYVNPGGSVKDRIAIRMIEVAEREGHLKPGGTIIEATAGNTGVGLAMVAAIKGYRCIFVLPDKMSEDKISLLKAYGAEVVITRTDVSPDSSESYNGVAERLEREVPGAFRPNQFYNPENSEAHYLTTGPEIWEDANGMIDAFVAGMGTGGTISGTGRYLKEKNPNIMIIGADPEGSILSGDSPKRFDVEGIGEDFIPKTFDRQVVDEMIRISDKESFNTARRLAREEGLMVGGSSGTAVAAALKYAQRLEEGRHVVAICPDTGRNYLTKMFSDRWMQERGYWEEQTPIPVILSQLIKTKKNMPLMVSVTPNTALSEALSLMYQHNISQLPVIENGQSLGSIKETTLMKRLYDGVDFKNQKVSGVMSHPLPEIDADTDMAEAYRILLSGSGAVLVTEKGVPKGVLSRMDVIQYLSEATSNDKEQ